MDEVAGYYSLSEDSYQELVQLRDHLRLLEAVAAPRFAQDDDCNFKILLAPRALAQSLGAFASSLDQCIEEVRWMPGSV